MSFSFTKMIALPLHSLGGMGSPYLKKKEEERVMYVHPKVSKI